MMVIGVSVFMSSFTVDIQAYVGIAVVILFMTMHISSNPYNSAVLDRMEKYALATAFVTLYVGLLFYISKEENTDQSTLVMIGSLFIVGVNAVYMTYACWEIALYYSSKHKGKVKSVLLLLEPVLNVVCCRKKKAIKRTRRLLHKQTILMKAGKKKLNKMKEMKKNSSKVTPIVSTSDDAALRTWGG